MSTTLTEDILLRLEFALDDVLTQHFHDIVPHVQTLVDLGGIGLLGGIEEIVAHLLAPGCPCGGIMLKGRISRS